MVEVGERSEQDPVSRYSNEIWRLLTDESKYVDGAVERHNSTVRIWYAGELPAALGPLIADAAAHGVRIDMVHTRFDWDQTQRAARAMRDALESIGITKPWISFGTPAGGPGSGLTVGLPGLTPDTAEKVSLLAEVSVPGVPVVVRNDDRPLPIRI